MLISGNRDGVRGGKLKNMENEKMGKGGKKELLLQEMCVVLMVNHQKRPAQLSTAYVVEYDKRLMSNPGHELLNILSEIIREVEGRWLLGLLEVNWTTTHG